MEPYNFGQQKISISKRYQAIAKLNSERDSLLREYWAVRNALSDCTICSVLDVIIADAGVMLNDAKIIASSYRSVNVDDMFSRLDTIKYMVDSAEKQARTLKVNYQKLMELTERIKQLNLNADEELKRLKAESSEQDARTQAMYQNKGYFPPK